MGFWVEGRGFQRPCRAWLTSPRTFQSQLLLLLLLRHNHHMFIDHLLCTRHCSKRFACVKSFASYNNPILQKRKWRPKTDAVMYVPEDTQLENGRARTAAQGFLAQNLLLVPCYAFFQSGVKQIAPSRQKAWHSVGVQQDAFPLRLKLLRGKPPNKTTSEK